MRSGFLIQRGSKLFVKCEQSWGFCFRFFLAAVLDIRICCFFLPGNPLSLNTFCKLENPENFLHKNLFRFLDNVPAIPRITRYLPSNSQQVPVCLGQPGTAAGGNGLEGRLDSSHALRDVIETMPEFVRHASEVDS